MNGKQETYYEVIGVSEYDDLIMLDYIFNDKPNGWSNGRRFKGATGTSFRPMYQDEINETTTVEYVIEVYGYLHEEMRPQDYPEAPDQSDYETWDDADLIMLSFDQDSYDADYAEWEKEIKDNQIAWAESFLDHCGEYGPVQDDSYVSRVDEDLIQQVYPGAVTLTCTGGGRMFPREALNLKTVFRPDLVTKILNAEHYCRIYDVEA